MQYRKSLKFVWKDLSCQNVYNNKKDYWFIVFFFGIKMLVLQDYNSVCWDSE